MPAISDQSASDLVFLSHASPDKPAVKRLAAALEGRGYRVWLDEWSITAGQRIVREVQRGLEDCECVVVWLTPEAVRSRWVEEEWQSVYHGALPRGRPIIVPALAEPCEVPLLLQGIKHANFATSWEDGLRELLVALKPLKASAEREPTSSPESETVAGPQVDVTVKVSLNGPPSALKIRFLRALADLMEGEPGNPTQQRSP